MIDFMAIFYVHTPFNIDLEFKSAPVLKRLLSWGIDLFLMTIFMYFIITVGGLHSKFTFKGVYLLWYALLIGPPLFYQLAVEILFDGQTLGKRLLGLRVIDIEGKQPTWSQYMLRWILSLGNLSLYIIPLGTLYGSQYLLFIWALFSLVYAPDYICVLVSKLSQTPGDIAAGTIVIDTQYATSIGDTIYQEIEVNSYTVLFPNVLKLTDRDINGIRNLVANEQKNRGMDDYTHKVAHKLKGVLKVESELQSYDFLRQLLRDYNYLTARDSYQKAN